MSEFNIPPRCGFPTIRRKTTDAEEQLMAVYTDCILNQKYCVGYGNKKLKNTLICVRIMKYKASK